MTPTLLNGSRRSFLMGGAAAMAALGLTRPGISDALAQATPEGQRKRSEMMEFLEDYGFLWTATSPATRLDDTATILLTNGGAAPLDIVINTIIMDHQAHHNEMAIDEMFTLTAGESRTLTAVNDYGQANHFSTRMIASSGDPQELGVEVTMTDASGTQTASFNERAFWIKTFAEIQANAEARRLERIESNGHEEH